MTPREADRAIKSGKPVKVRWPRVGEEGTILILRRTRWSIYCEGGSVFDRGDTELIKQD